METCLWYSAKISEVSRIDVFECSSSGSNQNINDISKHLDTRAEYIETETPI